MLKEPELEAFGLLWLAATAIQHLGQGGLERLELLLESEQDLLVLFRSRRVAVVDREKSAGAEVAAMQSTSAAR